MVKGTQRGSANKDGGAVQPLGGAETSRRDRAATAPRRQPPHGVRRQSPSLTPRRGRQSPSAIALFLSKGKHVRRRRAGAGLPRAPRVSNTTSSKCNRLGSVVLTLGELRKITNNFSDKKLIGEGAFGKVYKGVLTTGDTIAVKKFASTITGLQDGQYENEAQRLMRLKHPNIVQLVGYCSETVMKIVWHNGKYVRAEKPERLLCLEYMAEGSLRDHLSAETSGLEWNTRYKIIKGICYGLHYLHEEWQATPIIHMDLKPANILLDDNMVPKIADFGLSRLFGEEQTRTCTGSRKGTPGYMAPEYLEKGVITKKFDIFSLGVIIIEIITGLKNFPTYETETASQQYIDLVLDNWRHRKAQGYTSQDIDHQQIKKCIQIGLLCVKFDPVKRPTIKQIIKMLERSDEAYQNEREARSPPRREMTRLTLQREADSDAGRDKAGNEGKAHLHHELAAFILLQVSLAFITVCLSTMNSPARAPPSQPPAPALDDSIPREQRRTSSPHYDGYQWRKYRMKRITKTQFPRCYFKCSFHSERNCRATKQVQQCSNGDPPQYVVMYFNEHTCDASLLDERGVQEEHERRLLVSSLAALYGYKII